MSPPGTGPDGPPGGCVHGASPGGCAACRATAERGRPPACVHGYAVASCPHCPGGRLAYLDQLPGAAESRARDERAASSRGRPARPAGGAKLDDGRDPERESEPAWSERES